MNLPALPFARAPRQAVLTNRPSGADTVEIAPERDGGGISAIKARRLTTIMIGRAVRAGCFG
jgi:hypothetical protein